MLLTAAWQAINLLLTPQHWKEGVALAEEFISSSREGARARTVGQIGEFCGIAFSARGDRANAELAWRQLVEVADRSKDAFTVLNAMSFQGVLATMDGRLEEAVQIGLDLVATGEDLGMPDVGNGMSARACGRAYVYLGRPFPLELDTRFAGMPGAGGDFVPVLLDASRSRLTERSERLSERLDYLSSLGGDSDPFVHAALVAVALETAVMLRDTETAARLLPWAAQGPPATDPRGVSGCNARVVAGAHALLGEPGQARDWYQLAIEACTKLRFRPELALTRLGLAELLLEQYPHEHAEAIEHLDYAIAEFREMKMQPSLERALTRQQSLKN